MKTHLSWNDLFIESISPELAASCLADWDFLLGGRFAVVGMSKFGDWFLRRPDGSTDELSAIEGALSKVADTPEDFIRLMNEPHWQGDHLLSGLVAQLHSDGMIPEADQCYGFAPHPILVGHIDKSAAMIFSIPVWQTICAQTFSEKKCQQDGPPNDPPRGSFRGVQA